MNNHKDVKEPAISVVIPCFRSGKLLSEAIESVLKQTDTDWELILVDNNSSEDTKRVIAKYVNLFPEKIRMIHENEQGVCSARNRGILDARGVYVALLDDDDLMYPDRLSLQKNALEKNPSAILCYGAMDKVSGDNSLILESCVSGNHFTHFLGQSSIIARKFLIVLDFKELMPSTMFFRKKTAIRAGLFDTHFNPCFLEDTDFCFRMSQIGSFEEINKPIIRFRIPFKEFLFNKRINILEKYRLLLNHDYFLSKLINSLKEKDLLQYSIIKNDLKAMISRWLREASFDFLTIQGGERFARILLWRGLKENPRDLRSIKHLIRSFYPVKFRRKIYGNQQIFEEEVSNEITEKFLKEIYKKPHFCEYCKNHMRSNKL